MAKEEPGGIPDAISIDFSRRVRDALKDADGAPCKIHTDSEFWINVITKWSIGWEAKGWKKSGGEIKNLDIVKEVCPLYRSSNAELVWVRGHVGNEGNELADEWANKARQQRRADEYPRHETPPCVTARLATRRVRTNPASWIRAARNGHESGNWRHSGVTGRG